MMNFLGSYLKRDRSRAAFLVFFLFFLVVTVFSFTKYPVIHIDEAWMSSAITHFEKTGQWNMGLSVYRERPYSFGEYGNIFLGLQYISFSLFGYSLLAARLVSYLAFLGTLFFMWKLARCWEFDRSVSFLALTFFLVSRTVFYGSHLARSEALLTFVFMFLLYLYFSYRGKHPLVLFGLGGLASLSVEIHVNGLIICLTLGAILLADVFVLQKKTMREFLFFVAGGVISFVLVIVLHYMVQHDFYTYLLERGGSSGTFSLTARFGQLADFLGTIYFNKKFFSKSLPELLLALGVLAALGFEIFKDKNKKLLYPLLILFSVWSGIIIIARYNYYYYYLLIPVMALIAGHCLSRRFCFPLITLILAANTGIDLYQVGANSRVNVRRMREYIRKEVILSEKTTVLGEVSFQYYIGDYDYIAFRDFDHYRLHSEDPSAADYFDKYGITAVVIDDYLERRFSESIAMIKAELEKRSASKTETKVFTPAVRRLTIYTIPQ